MKRNLFVIAFILISLQAYSQPINRISNYLQNQLYFNPASSGMYDQQLNVGLLNKFQWAGVKGAPLNSFLWIDYKTKEKGLSFGTVIDRFAHGATKKMGVSFNSTYSVLLGHRLRLAMGLRLGLDQMTFNPTGLYVFDEGDEVLGNKAFRQTFLKIGAGMQLRSANFHLGVASVDLFMNDKNKYLNSDSAGFFSRPRNYVFNTGYKWTINDSYNITPSAIAYLYNGTNSVVGAGFIFEVKDYFWAGTNFYSSKTETFTVGTYISSRIRFIYTYQVDFKKTLAANSHELNLLFRMDKVIKSKSK